MVTGDFVPVCSAPEHVGHYDAVATCFFIDTAHNIVEYLSVRTCGASRLVNVAAVGLVTFFYSHLFAFVRMVCVCNLTLPVRHLI